LIEQSGSSVRPLFMIVLVTWIVLIFASFGFNAPRNATVLTAFLVCALAIGGAIFLILEMDGPFDGYITVSSKPMHSALAYMERP
jgi:membrane-bound ClpP family serine protease